jgi:hypothetical protein
MRNLLPIAALLFVGRTAAQTGFATVALSDSVRKDVQCFVLYAAAAGQAKDDKTRQVASVGTMYFVGRLDAGARGLDLAEAARQEGDALQKNPNIKDIGDACDKRLSQRGAALIELGKQLGGSAH